MKKEIYVCLTLLLATLLIECKETGTAFSPGTGDARITGAWQLVERRYAVEIPNNTVDSVLVPQYYRRDTVRLNGTYRIDSVLVKAHYEKQIIKSTKSVDTTRRYSASQPQTLNFDTDGKLTANGPEMSYYYPIKYYRVDTTYPDSLSISFYITTNRANVYFQQGLKFKGDSLIFLPRCERPCYSKFIRAK